MTHSRTQPAGYADPAYARCFDYLGEPVHLPCSNGWIIRRTITDTDLHDAMGAYPLFSCADWSALASDMEQLRQPLVSVSVVPEPFGKFDLALLKKTFPDLVVPFKHHFVADLSRPPESFVSKHHLRNVRKAGRILEVEICQEPTRVFDDWVKLYACLTQRHEITGVRAWPKSSLWRQLRVPGVTAFCAKQRGKVVGMVLWIIERNVVNYHIGAYTEQGYRAGASFILFFTALHHFRETGLQWLNLQGAAGIRDDSTTGLARFKAGWSTEVRQAYFCGRILDRQAYQKLITPKRLHDTDYFPAYRSGEFA